jgi:hypothetical protein
MGAEHAQILRCAHESDDRIVTRGLQDWVFAPLKAFFGCSSLMLVGIERSGLRARMGGMRNDPADSSPPIVFRDVSSGAAHDLPESRVPLKTDWRDFVAITLAVYQILLGPLLLIIMGIVAVYLLFLWLAR